MLYFPIVYFGLLAVSPFDGPQHSSEVTVIEADQNLRDAERVIVIADLSDPNAHVLNLQDFRINGEMVIPFFIDEAEFKSQIAGSGFEDKGVTIETEFLATLLTGSEVFMLNPAQPNPRRFTATELVEMWGKP